MNLPARSHRHPATNSSPPLVNRRVVLKASAMLASLVSGTRTAIEPPQTAAAAGSTASYDWYEAAELGAIGGSADSGPIVVPTSFPFTAVGAHWDGAAGDWPVVEVHISYDGENWSEPFRLEASHDRGQPTRDDRIFTGLLCANGATHIAYAVFDAAGHRTTVPGFALTYIDSSGGPALQAMGAENGAMSSPPQIVSRSEWGADESYRFTESGEWWTLRYETVRHAILHHSETSNVDDPLEAMRSIYHYHAVTRGWHDIGYNFLVDRYGNIYQGRVGGQNVVAGHAFAYSTGSCGIAFLGNHTFADISEAALASMVAIVAWAVRFQDPWGSAEFHDIADLPTICGHRDVSNTLCPGDFAYDDLEIIRSLVAETLAVKHDGPAGHLVVGDYVETNDGANLREDAGMSPAIVETVTAGVQGVVDLGPVVRDGMVWYRVATDYATGWTIGDALERRPPLDWKRGRFGREEFVTLIDSAALRQLPSVSAPLITVMDAGEGGSVLGGPEMADENRWYKVDTAYGEGWVAARFLSSGVGGSFQPSGGLGGAAAFSVGDDVVVFDGPVNVRSQPGETGAILASLESHAQGVVLSEPVMATGDVWYEVETDSLGGWIAGGFLTHALVIGYQARVTVDAEGLSVRVLPGISGDVVAIELDGGIVRILAGPELADGLTWWLIEGSEGQGWVAGAFLNPV